MKRNMNPKKGINKRIRSFGYAFMGIYQLFSSEPNAKIHFVATAIAVTAGFFFRISHTEWCIVIIVIALVWMAECFNTVIEKLVDHLFREYHETARITKDISSGAVLVCAILAFICGLMIFLPKLYLLVLN